MLIFFWVLLWFCFNILHDLIISGQQSTRMGLDNPNARTDTAHSGKIGSALLPPHPNTHSHSHDWWISRTCTLHSSECGTHYSCEYDCMSVYLDVVLELLIYDYCGSIPKFVNDNSQNHAHPLFLSLFGKES